MTARSSANVSRVFAAAMLAPRPKLHARQADRRFAGSQNAPPRATMWSTVFANPVQPGPWIRQTPPSRARMARPGRCKAALE
jgi:hypothetical protein